MNYPLRQDYGFDSWGHPYVKWLTDYCKSLWIKSSAKITCIKSTAPVKTDKDVAIILNVIMSV